MAVDQTDSLTREMTAMAQSMRTEYVDLSKMSVDKEIANLIPETMAKRYRLLCIGKVENRLVCAMEDPLDLFALDDLKIKTRYDVQPVLCAKQHLEQTWQAVY